MTESENHDVAGASIRILPTPARKNESGKKKDIHAMIVGAMIGTSQTRWPAFPAKLHRWVDHLGESLVYEEDGRGIVRPVVNGHIDHLIARYWEDLDRGEFELGTLTADDVAKTRKLWFARAPGRAEPFPLLTWKSDPRPAHHKMAFDPHYVDLPTPLYDEMLGRMTNARAFCAWIGSLFDDQSQRQQYVWIYGDGDNGKGTFVRCLMAALGTAAHPETVPSKDSKHWTWGLIGKRLVVFSECEQPDFVTTGLFKSLTGEDRLRVEVKQGAIMSMNMPLKVMFTSNNKPAITGAISDTRRIIYCSIAPVDKKWTGNYEEALDAETPAFLSACWRAYGEDSSGNPRAVFATDNGDEIDDLISNTEHEFDAFVGEYLRFDCDDRGIILPPPCDPVKGVAPIKDRTFTTTGQMMESLIDAGFRAEKDRREFKKYLSRKHGIHVIQGKVNDPRNAGKIKKYYLFPDVRTYKKVPVQ